MSEPATVVDVLSGGEPPLLWAQPSAQRYQRRELTVVQAIQLWAQKRQQGQ